jgi:hypothetical protein
METNALTKPETAQALTGEKQAQATQLAALCGQMELLVGIMSARLKALETVMKSRVTITYAQSRCLMRAATRQADAICGRYGLPVQQGGKALRAALWRDFNREYGIYNRADLPAAYYEQATAFIGEWTSYAAIRRIRERAGL